MKRLSLACATLAIITGFALKGSFIHWLVVFGAIVYLGAPLAAFMGIWCLLALNRSGSIPSGLRTTFLASTMVMGSLLLSLGSGTAIHHWEIHEARTYVAEIIPKLDEYRSRHGKYPESLTHLNASSPPRLLMEKHSYSADSNTFHFEYWDSAGLMDGYYLDSATRKWRHFD